MFVGQLDPLAEVRVNVQRINTVPDESATQLPEIVVQGTRIPWYVWAILGGIAATLLFSRPSRG